MGILRSEIIFLIFGVLSLATGHKDEILENIVEGARSILLDAEVLDQEVVKYMESTKGDCNKYGGAKAFGIAKKGSEEFTKCLMQVFAPDNGFDMSTSGLDDYIGHYCPKVQPVQNCIEPFLNSIKPCLDNENLRVVNVLPSWIISVMNYACESNGERIKTFIDDSGLECNAIRGDLLRKCSHQFLGQLAEAGGSNTGIWKLASLNQNSLLEKCKSFKEFESCVDEQFKQCNKPSITKMGNYVVHSLYEKAGCVEILGSAASPTTIINSLLVITGIAMLL